MATTWIARGGCLALQPTACLVNVATVCSGQRNYSGVCRRQDIRLCYFRFTEYGFSVLRNGVTITIQEFRLNVTLRSRLLTCKWLLQPTSHA
ncbi:hypothetical protein VDGE_30494 [Verticillium dahliae]|uniref:Secreted protein n=1 Tax=Verticillium dahliae TaxID=27337 RepID=A0A444RRY7_VERDA|nr:hypothetical protein VDGE_30494 [Verticillium dahliae]